MKEIIKIDPFEPKLKLALTDSLLPIDRELKKL